MQRLNELLGSFEYFSLLIVNDIKNINQNNETNNERDKKINEVDKNLIVQLTLKNTHLNKAFFILCWGIVDNYLDEQCRALIKKKQASVSWEEKRGFLIYNVSDKKLSGLSLEEKVDLLINKVTDLPLNKKIKQLYKSRNLIAHGKEYSQSIDLFEFDGLIQNLNKAITL